MAVFIALGNVEVEASSATTSTYTLDYKGNFVSTQDAYLPKLTFTELGLNNPSDLFINNDIVYISDTGNDRVVLLDANTGEVINELSEFIFEGKDYRFKLPTGLYVNVNPHETYGVTGALLYVCDGDSKSVYIFNEALECIKIITKPTSILFANRDFVPQKIATDLGGNMYIIGEGINEGIMQLSVQGEFLGYFATNEVQLSLKEQLQDLLYTDEQKDKLTPKTPPVFSSVYADSRGMVYSTTISTVDYAFVQKHNTAGQNQFTKYNLYAEYDMVDIYTDYDGVVYSVSKTGYIYVYTEQGEFIYCFGGGGSVSSPDINGIFKEVTALAVDDDRGIWVLDKKKAMIQTFVTTDYSDLIYAAYGAYLDSDYSGSIELWNEVLRLNQMSNLAHNNIGLNYLYSQQYIKAMEHLKISNNKIDYSKAYWEVRNIWLQENLTTIFIIALCLTICIATVVIVNKKKPFLAPVKSGIDKVMKVSIIKEYTDMFRIARHPEDGFYDLKTHKKGSFRGAILIFITLFICFMIYLTSKGFIYQTVEVQDIDFFSVVFGFFAIIFVSIICNHLVTSITDGNGTLKDIFVLLMYSVAPLIIGLISIVILSHFLTESEAFFLDVVLYISAGWSVILVGMGMMEIQGYSFKQLFSSILLTFLLVVIIVLVLLIVFVLSSELINFIKLLFQEVIRLVQK
ncbi:MAG: YIP1 family protein [Acholeplasmatales bacterium]|nr:YIP1 family protein [Acholeplasmatales bacterium]